MPYRQPMNWEGAPNFRWRKFHKGNWYRVHCKDLGLPKTLWTEEGSRSAANEWWDRQMSELEAVEKPVLDPVNQQLAAILEGNSLGDLRRLAHQGKEADRILTMLETASVNGQDDAEARKAHRTAQMPLAELAVLPIPQPVITSALTDGVLDDDEDVAATRMRQAAKTLSTRMVENIFTLRHHADKFLTKQRAREKKATTYAEVKRTIDKLVDMIGEKTDARTVNEATIEGTFLKIKALPWQERTRRKTWMIFLRLIDYLFKGRLIDLPRNLDDFDFTVVKRKIKRYTVKEVKAELKALPERLRLYALLGLNCGMLGVDMASFTWDELDQKTWRITRKRTKTGDKENVPTVSYKLWKLTIVLLKKHKSDDPTLVLTSKTGTPLWQAWTDPVTGKPKKKDLIVLQYKRNKKHTIKLKEFRSIGATIIGDEMEKGYGRYVGHYLGHSPKGMEGIHYVPPSDELFDEILAYVGRQLGMT